MTATLIIAIFLWIGFLGAISFMEAWLKFQAPGVTLPIGLGIGKLVFAALNKMEFVMAVLIIFSLFRLGDPFKMDHLIIAIPIFLLLLQLVWLTPFLDARADARIAGETVPDSKLHVLYIVFEVIKMIMLWWFGLKILLGVLKPFRPPLIS